MIFFQPPYKLSDIFFLIETGGIRAMTESLLSQFTFKTTKNVR